MTTETEEQPTKSEKTINLCSSKNFCVPSFFFGGGGGFLFVVNCVVFLSASSVLSIPFRFVRPSEA